MFEANGSLKYFNINAGKENLGRLEAAAYELRLTGRTLSGVYTANNIIAETNVNVTGTAQLKAGVSVTLKPGFTAASGCSLKVAIDNTLVVEPEKYYYVKDHLGSTRVTVDEEGVIANYYDYDPWGMQLDGRNKNDGISNDKYKFTGKERDGETNYDYFGARYYDSRIGRWLQVDPLAEKYQGWSSFNYTLNNPFRLIDVNGLEPEDNTKVWVGTETTGFGHVFIVIYKGDGDMTVWTYGRYDGGYLPSSTGGGNPVGDGVLRKLTGESAQNFVSQEIHENKAQFFPVEDADEKGVSGFYEGQYYSSDVKSVKYPKDGKVIDVYVLPANNCVTKTLDGLKAGGAETPVINYTQGSQTNSGSPTTPEELQKAYSDEIIRRTIIQNQKKK